MKAITCKYLGPTNFKGSRVKASDGDGNSVTVGYDSSRSRDGAFQNAAIALCRKMNWKGSLIGGQSKTGEMVFVFDGGDLFVVA